MFKKKFEIFKRLNLKFCGFEDKTITKKFIKTNSNNDLYNLNKWTEFEEDNPNTFSGMYQFWCQYYLTKLDSIFSH